MDPLSYSGCMGLFQAERTRIGELEWEGSGCRNGLRTGFPDDSTPYFFETSGSCMSRSLALETAGLLLELCRVRINDRQAPLSKLELSHT